MREVARPFAIPSANQFLWSELYGPALATAANQTLRKERFERKPRLQEQARRFDTCSHDNANPGLVSLARRDKLLAKRVKQVVGNKHASDS